MESQLATGVGELGSADVAALDQTRLTVLQRRQHEQICALVEPLLTQTDLIHDAFTERQLGHALLPLGWCVGRTAVRAEGGSRASLL
jgi:hypothetical protein